MLTMFRKDKPVGKSFGQGFAWDEALDAIADTYNGFVFWTLLTSLGLLVWYFPLWHMGISGYEVMIMVTVSPALLGIPAVRSLVVKNLRIVHLISTVGLLAYLVKSPEYRLFVLGFALSMSILAWTASWYAERNQEARLEGRILAWTIGLIASSVAKFAFWTNNPLWPIMHAENGGWNRIGFAVAVLAVLRSTRQTSLSGGRPESGRSGSSFLASCGIAGLLFGLHSLLSDSSTMILWVWEGYPVRGPIPANGVVTIAAMGAGVMIGKFYRHAVSNERSLALTAVGAFMVTAFSNWLGYIGALLLACNLTSLAIPLITSAVRCGPGLTFGLGFMLYNLMVLAHVWVVAYAFVPGGPLLREHTDWVMIATVLLLSAGVYAIPNKRNSQKAKRGLTGQATGRYVSYYIYVLVALELLAVSTAYLRFPTNDYVPYHKDDKIITAGIWTVHFSLDNDMWSSERRMRDVIKELEIDVIGLLETDLQRIIMGNRDTSQYLAEDLGMYLDQGPGPNKHTWGAVLLSKFPIVNSTHHLLPSPVGELAPAIHATLDAYGELVDVLVFHSGQEEDPEDRRLQSEYLAQLMHDSPRPTILLSYLVTRPLEGNYNTYVGEKSGMKDIDPSDWDRWCEYILYKGLKRTGYARVSRSTITDTEIQVTNPTTLIILGFLLTSLRSVNLWLASQRDRMNALAKTRFPKAFDSHLCSVARVFEVIDIMYSTSLGTIARSELYRREVIPLVGMQRLLPDKTAVPMVYNIKLNMNRSQARTKYLTVSVQIVVCITVMGLPLVNGTITLCTPSNTHSSASKLKAASLSSLSAKIVNDHFAHCWQKF